MTEAKRKELTPKQKGENVAFAIMLMSILPMFVGMGAEGIVDHFNVKELHEQGDIMAWVWVLSAIAFMVIGISFCTWLILKFLRWAPGMRESMSAIWEDDEGQPLPEPEPRPISPEGRRKMNRMGYWFTLMLFGLIGMASSVIMLGMLEHWKNFMGWAEQQELTDLDKVLAGASEMLMFAVFLTATIYLIHRMMYSEYGSYLKPYLPDPKSYDDDNNQEGADEE